MGKTIKSDANPGFFAQGGKTKMFGRQFADPQTPGTSAQETDSSESSKGQQKFAKGGTTKMMGKGHAAPALPGVSAKNSQ